VRQLTYCPEPRWGVYRIQISHSPFTLANFSFVNLVFIFRSSSSTTNPVCERRVDLLVCSLSLHRHSYIGFILAFASSIHNKHEGQSRSVHGIVFTPYTYIYISWEGREETSGESGCQLKRRSAVLVSIRVSPELTIKRGSNRKQNQATVKM
jgi:hypothetical protein